MTADRLNFREECGKSSPVLGVLTRDETVTVLGSELGTWVRVRNADGEEGCVSAQYLEIDSAPAEADSMAMPSEDPQPYAWADLTDSDSAEIVSEIEELEGELAGASDPDDQEDLRQEIAELEDDLRARQQELAEEREATAREAHEAAFAAGEVAAGSQGEEAGRARGPAYVSGNWSGFYTGVNVGYGFGGDFSASNNLGTLEEDITGVEGGVQLGYLHQFNRFGLGVEGDYVVSDQSGEIDLAPLGFPGSSLEEQYEYFGSIRIRVGIARDRTFVYATGGYSFGEVELKASGPIAGVVADQSTDVDGWIAGAGVEVMMRSSLSLKGEGLVRNSDDVPEDDFEGGEAYVVRVGANWRF